MKPLIQLKTTAPLLIALVLLGFALLPKALAVVPPPDGGYPNFTTAEGQNALFSLTTGAANTAVGWRSLFSNTDGSYNTAVGAGTLLFNIGDQTAFEGVDNTAVGAAALLFNTTGTDNTATGVAALLNNTGGSNNTATGSFALQSNTTGNLNTANGLSALLTNTSGIGNIAEGGGALVLNTTGSGNTAIGTGALGSNTTGNGNIAVGSAAGHALTTGDQNIVIGNANAVAGESNTMRIGNSLSQTRAFIAGILGNGPFGCDVSIDAVTGQLGVGACISSERFKKDIDSMNKASEAIFSLKPVTFHYKNDKTNIPQFGLIAEEVAKVNPALIAVDKEGKPYSVRYEAVNAMLLNEFLKEHRRGEEQDCKIQEQETTIAELRSEIRSLAAMVNDQASEFRKVSAQLQISNAAAQEIASNSP